jgi:hypothetical protein
MDLLANFGMSGVGVSRVGRGVSSYSTVGSGPVDHLEINIYIGSIF